MNREGGGGGVFKSKSVTLHLALLCYTRTQQECYEAATTGYDCRTKLDWTLLTVQKIKQLNIIHPEREQLDGLACCTIADR